MTKPDGAPKYTTTLENMLKESLGKCGETLADVEYVSLPEKMKLPIPCDCCGGVTLTASLGIWGTNLFVWTKNRVHFLDCPFGEYYEIRSIPRNSPY